MIGTELTIVVAATDSPEAVARLLESVDGRAEMIVVTGDDVPRLRRIGLDRARGRVVVFTEDSCVLEPGWVQAWLDAFADPRLVAATGLVSHASDSAVEWAVVFCEYAPFLMDVSPGQTRPRANSGAGLRARLPSAWPAGTIDVSLTGTPTSHPSGAGLRARLPTAWPAGTIDVSLRGKPRSHPSGAGLRARLPTAGPAGTEARSTEETRPSRLAGNNFAVLDARSLSIRARPISTNRLCSMPSTKPAERSEPSKPPSSATSAGSGWPEGWSIDSDSAMSSAGSGDRRPRTCRDTWPGVSARRSWVSRSLD